MMVVISIISVAMFFYLKGQHFLHPKGELVNTRLTLLYTPFAFDNVDRRYTHHISTLRKQM